MEGSRTWLGVGVPQGWPGVLTSSLLAAVVAFASLLFKEWFETGEWDVPACFVDGSTVGAGMLLLNVILKLTRS